MERAYAQALWQAVQGGMDAAKAVRAMRDMLVASGREALMPRIGRAFSILAVRESGKRDIIVTVARESDARSALKEAKSAIESLGIEIGAADLKTRVDETIVGGWRLEGSEILVDRSYKSALLSMYDSAVRA